ncbi:MAG TPA: serine/threonine-protein kinase, partial [Micromonospora sp.]
MGEVWLGRDTKLDREIAVKFIRFPDGSRDEEYIRRFVRESRITARLEHPGVPAVYDVGVDDGRPFLVMQRIRGISVADLVAEQGALPIGWSAAIGAQVCAVLVAAHRASLVHRDLKPSNLMLEPDGRVKVLDFGLAVAPTLADFSRITHTGQPLGTPAYMAPEQVEANLSSPATDLYALGCTLHEMLSGEHLFIGSTSYSVMSKQVKEPPPALRSLRADVPPALERLVLDLLEKKPQSRPASAEVVYHRLLPFATDLGPLPGALGSPSAASPVRMYARVLSRVFAEAIGTPAAPASTPPEPSALASGMEGESRLDQLNRSDLDRTRTEAHELVHQSRYSQAAEVLAEAVGPASRTFGGTD